MSSKTDSSQDLDRPNTLQVIFEVFNALFSMPLLRASAQGFSKANAQALIEALPELELERVDQVEGFIDLLLLAARSNGEIEPAEGVLIEAQLAHLKRRLRSWAVRRIRLSTRRARLEERVSSSCDEHTLASRVWVFDSVQMRKDVFMHVLALLLLYNVVPSEVDFSCALARAFGFDEDEKLQVVRRAQTFARRFTGVRSSAHQ